MTGQHGDDGGDRSILKTILINNNKIGFINSFAVLSSKLLKLLQI